MNPAGPAPTFERALFAQRQVLVVGGTSGIGAAVAAAFLGLRAARRDSHAGGGRGRRRGRNDLITFFNIHGAMVYVDDRGAVTGYEDVFTKIAMCRKHYEACGLGAAYVEQFMR